MATVVLPKWRQALVANAHPVVANTGPQKVANKHGVYADKDKRRVYMRELMRKKRAEAKLGQV